MVALETIGFSLLVILFFAGLVLVMIGGPTYRHERGARPRKDGKPGDSG